MAAIRGSGETTYASTFIDAFVETECNSQIKSWFSRVPSHSDPADGVSRLLCDLPARSWSSKRLDGGKRQDGGQTGPTAETL